MKRFVVAAIAALALVGTVAASGAGLQQMVLSLGDLPAGFALDYSHAMTRAQVATQQDYVAPGFVAAWESQFTRSEGVSSAVIRSSVSRYKTTQQAHASIAHTWSQATKMKQGMKVARVSTGTPLGHEARMFRGDDNSGAIVYVVVWRYGSLKAGVMFGGSPLVVTARQTVQLAQRQQAHMRRAVEGS
jgi:hypothetical protein